MQRDFQTFGVAHNFALLLTLLTAVGLVCYARRNPNEEVLRRIRYVIGTLLITAVALDPILSLYRYGFNEYGWSVVVDNSLPFYLCDVVSIMLAIALFKKSQRLAEIGYLWGLGGAMQGLIMPTLLFDWREIEFYAFFLEHSGAPIAAAFLVWGLGIVPEKGAFRRAVWWSFGYVAVVMLINVLIGENYGFLNGKPDAVTFFDYMGPWPYYLITLHAVAFSLYVILLGMAPEHKAAKDSF